MLGPEAVNTFIHNKISIRRLTIFNTFLIDLIILQRKSFAARLQVKSTIIAYMK
jgi:hypothetical protein